MRIIAVKQWEHRGVSRNGSLPNKPDGSRGGSVNTRPNITASIASCMPNGAGGWICFNEGLNLGGVVKGTTIYFENDDQVIDVIKQLSKLLKYAKNEQPNT